MDDAIIKRVLSNIKAVTHTEQSDHRTPVTCTLYTVRVQYSTTTTKTARHLAPRVRTCPVVSRTRATRAPRAALATPLPISPIPLCALSVLLPQNDDEHFDYTARSTCARAACAALEDAARRAPAQHTSAHAARFSALLMGTP